MGELAVPQKWVDGLGLAAGGLLRWSLVLFFVGFGLLKFTPDEARAIAPLMAHSPFLAWLESWLGEQGSSHAIGLIEVVTGILIALRRWRPTLSAYGSFAAGAALCVTLSFLFTTPGLDADPWASGFLAKDLTLLGAALWCAAEAMDAAQGRRSAVT